MVPYGGESHHPLGGRTRTHGVWLKGCRKAPALRGYRQEHYGGVVP
ncbi:hypothetical protein D051_0803 [Vibrio parahaemolyticus VPCR-2010]|nr:hypothetical protein D051_0803 [Vibrio parahaemolyticus VPCR-2010]